jgi:protein O-GlcNAc transferase
MQNTQLMQNAYSLHRAGRLAEAARLYGEVLRSEPRHFDALYLLASVHSQTGELDAALTTLGEALKANPASIDALYSRALVFHRMGRLAEAVSAYDDVLVRHAKSTDALNNRGAALSVMGRYAEALESFDRAIAVSPGNAGAHSNRGNALLALQRYDEAIAGYDRALALDPRHIDALCNRGIALLDARRFAEAVTAFTAVLAQNPRRIEARELRGRALSELHLYAEALPDLEAAIAGQPPRADLYYNRANAFSVLKRYAEAIRDAKAALALDPDYPYARGILVHAKLHCCDWTGLGDEAAQVSRAIADEKRVLSPFELIALSHSPPEQLACAKLWVSDTCPPAPALWRGERYRHDRIRLAYVSADFRMHPVAGQMAGVFEAHDRSRFETIAVSITPEHESPFRTRLEAAFERFLDVRSNSDGEIARLMRDLEVDIAVDLTGFTRENRTGILAQRPAPIQVNYLGYPGTIGASYFDYILADRIVLPEEHRAFYSEQPVWLPDSFFPQDDKRGAPPQASGRAAVGLPATGFVFCSFNSNYKFLPDLFASWMRILLAVDGSVLWLPQPNDIAAQNLRREAQRAGVSPERLIFAPFLASGDAHLARLRAADLFLDSAPYGAHSSASDALWVGLPVLTALGRTFASRVAASLLDAAGLPELIASSLGEYENLAVTLARDPLRLCALRERLARSRAAGELFDTRRSCRSLEAAYEMMWQRHQQGHGPMPLSVAPEAERV